MSRSRSFSLRPGLGLFLFTFTLGLLTPAAYPQATIPQCPNPKGLSQTGPDGEEPAPRHQIRDFVPHPGSLATSATTSGYAVTGSAFTLAEGSWVVPAVDCTEVPNSQSAFWVGLDGLTGNPTLEQVGTESYCSGTTAKYYAWYEFLPDQQTSVKIKNFTINPKDKISTNVSYSNSTSQFTVTITDGAQSYSCWYQLAEQASRSSAEWLAEDPVNSVTKTLYPLADFGIADLGQDYTEVPNTNYAADASLPTPSPIRAFGSAMQEIAMVKNGVTEAIPSGLQTDGASFTVSTYLEFMAGQGASYEGTFPVSANKSGAVAGTYANPTNVAQGFIDSSSGKLKLFNVLGAGTTSRQGTFGLSINAAGTTAGYFSDANNLYHAYYCPSNCPSGLKAIPIDVCKTTGPNCPVAEFQQYDLGTAASAINDSGVLTGMWRDTNFVIHGWFGTSTSTATSFDASGAGKGPGQGTEPLAINFSGAIAGLYFDSNHVSHGFAGLPGSTFTIDPAGSVASFGIGINTADTVTGTWGDAGGVAHGFVCAALCQGGNPTSFDVPDAGGAACLISKHIPITQGTVAFGINTAGDITGVYTDANCRLHSFVRRARNGQIFYPVDAPDAGTGILMGTAGLSINDQGYIVGTFLDSTLAAHGFLHFVP